ncbi:MAG: tuf [Nocardioides sp.]|nr:tuf [Nocardioides sp.]
MKWPWKRDSTAERDVDALLGEANLASPPAGPAGPFRMTVEDVFVISGRGTVATGKIEVGSVTVGQQVRVVRAGAELGTTAVTGVEMFRKKLDTASAGDNVGLLVAGDVGESVKPGDVLAS